ncbi:MAG: GNAT family N-acetyltransferase [FCB group bacterium]|jgi:ribosomal protein S18 acetylase RimI-like enzyme|nr:GNAT family N-acetyltransferase [FCB group bacterium]
MILYTESLEGVTAERLRGFFHGWSTRPDAETHLRMLQNSDAVILAIDDRHGNVIGFVSAITDKVLTAHIPYVEVLPQYRNQGIGRELTTRMMKKLRDFYLVGLVCGMGLQDFYSSFGMTPANAMILRNTNASKETKD